jgi:tetratricopeptide (TPR) repeat protein
MQEAFTRSITLVDPKPVFASAWLLSFSFLLLWDPQAATSCLQPAVHRLDSVQASHFRQVLLAHLGICHVFAGRLDSAKLVCVEAPHRFLEANVCAFEGRFAEAEQILESEIGRARSAESTQQEWIARFWLGRFRRALKLYKPAEQQLSGALSLLSDAVRIPEEICTRSELALLLAQTGRVTEALVQIGYCDALMTSQDWRALRGFVDRARATALACEGQMTRAGGEFEKACAVFRKFGVAPEEAEVLVLWGECLVAHGEPQLGRQKLAEAFQIYYRMNFGARWLERCAGGGGVKSTADSSRQAMSSSQSSFETPEFNATFGAQQRHSDIYSFATTEDLALLGTLMHNAISHTMSAMDRLAKVQKPLDEIARTISTTRDICGPIERIAKAFESIVQSSTFTGRGRRVGRALVGGPKRDPESKVFDATASVRGGRRVAH